MAITYKFNCPKCDAKGEIYVGTTKIECKQGLPDYELASCAICKKLTHTNNKACPYCGTKAETGKWFSKKTGFKILDSSMIKGQSKIPCPKCNYKSLTATPIIFSD